MMITNQFYSFILFFLFIPILCNGGELEDAHEKMSTWAPVAGRLYMNSNRMTNKHELVVEFIWDSVDEFGTSENLKNGGSKSHAFELSIVFNDKNPLGFEYFNYSDFLECSKNEKIAYNCTYGCASGAGFVDVKKTTKDCDISSIHHNFEKNTGFYVDTRAFDDKNADDSKEKTKDFSFGLYEASNIITRNLDREPKVYKVKFDVIIDNEDPNPSNEITGAPFVLKVNKAFDIEKDRKDNIIADAQKASLSDPEKIVVFRTQLEDFCLANAPIKDENGKCKYDDSGKACYDLGREKSCIYETYLNDEEGYNVLITTQKNKCDKNNNCYELRAGRNSPYMTWCLSSKDHSPNDTVESASVIDIPDIDKTRIELFQCKDIDYLVLKPKKNAWYNLELLGQPGTNFDFELHDYRKYLSGITNKPISIANQQNDLTTREPKSEMMEAQFLEKDIEYLVKFISNADYYNGPGGWFTFFETSYFKPFSDVSPDTAYAAAIHTLYIKKIIKGYDDGTFKPDQNVNRPQFMKMLIKTISTTFGSSIFTDQCNCNDPAPAPCVVSKWWKKYTNCSLGYPSSSKPIYFWPINKDNYTEEQISNPPLTRGEVAKILAIAKQLPMSKNSHTEFTDIQGHRYQQEIAQCIDAKIFSGYKDAKLFKPDQYISRGEAAEILVRAYFEGKYRIY